MKTLNLKIIKPAKRYAEAFFEVVKTKDFKKAVFDIKKLNEFIKNDEKIRTFFNHPVVSNQDKKELIKETFKDFSIDVINFIFILIDENRMNCLNEIETFLDNKINLESGYLPVQITTAIELDEEKKNYIKEKLENKFNKKIIPDFKKDENIIGGLIIKLNDTVIDLSVNKKLENFKVI